MAEINNPFKIVDNNNIIIGGFGYFIGKDHGRLVVKENGKLVAQFPLTEVDNIIITSRGINISSSLIDELCRRGAKLCFWTGGSPNVMITSARLSAFVEAKRVQFDAYNTSVGLTLSKEIIKSKIHNQAAFLKYASKNLPPFEIKKIIEITEKMRLLGDKVSAVHAAKIDFARNDLLLLEANAASLYWWAFQRLLKTDMGFNGRDHIQSDPLNIMLNYGYSIVYSLVWMCILNAGLEPFAGFLHTDRPGKPSLVYDLSDPFKQRIVDKVVLAIVNKGRNISVANRLLSDESRKLLSNNILAELSKREEYAGKKLTLHSIIQKNIYSVVKELKTTAAYEPYRMKW
ncbi:MAG: CRISPR-associated endonuclease Cas1 [Thermodesulfobium sp.]